jgi:CRISPR/Cas system-associated exonuclease Cas4 (RecB family)
VLEKELMSAGEHAALTDYLRDAAERFRQSDLGARIAAGGEPRREQPFLLRVDDALIAGTIDAVLPDYAVVDYKTGRPKPELAARYEAQLRLYAAAVRQLNGVDVPEAFLYYIDSGEARRVPTGTAELDAALAFAADAVRSLRKQGATAVDRAPVRPPACSHGQFVE